MNKTKKITHLTDQWHVRDDNGGIFGPVTFSALKSWVEDGRVSPASEVSSGNGHWELAERVAELEMDCVAEIEPGSFYGPIHCKAMRGLIQIGSIPAEAVIYTRQGKQGAGASLPAEVGVSQAEHGTALAQLATLKSQKDDGERELRRVGAELAELRGLLQRERESASELSEKTEELQEELQRQIDELIASQRELEAVLSTRQVEITTLNRIIADYQLKIDAFSSEQENFAVEIDALRRENQNQREDMAAKNIQVAGLLQRLEELEQVNRGLKEEFVKYEGIQNSGRASDGIAQRKLVLMKNLFVEAARVLEGVEDCPEEPADEIQDPVLDNLAEGELLDYEEVSAEELKVRKGASASAQKIVTEINTPPAPERKPKTSNHKAEKKWSFGGTEKRMGHDSLAELEAQAQIELQRLSSSQNISSLFGRKK